jgi:hypothetical protein
VEERAWGEGGEPARPDPVSDDAPPLPPHPGKEGVGPPCCGGGGGRKPCRGRRRPWRIQRPRDCRHRWNRRGLPGAEEEEGSVGGGGRGRGRLGAPRAGRRKGEGPADRGRGRRLRLGRGRGAGRVGLGVGCSFYTRVDQG